MATWVVGDIHGCFDDFMEILNNPEVKDDDTIILIGDIIDRGENSVKMLKWAMENITSDGRYQMICGNHEDNIINDYTNTSMRAISRGHNPLEESIENLFCRYGFDYYMEEAGYKTLSDIKDIVEWMKKLPLFKKVTVETDNGNKDYIIAHAWYGKVKENEWSSKRAKHTTEYERENILWYRDVIGSHIDKEFDYSGSLGTLVHGHTPTISIDECVKKPLNEVLIRKNSINIDCGACFPQYGGNLASIRLGDEKVIYSRPQVKIKTAY